MEKNERRTKTYDALIPQKDYKKLANELEILMELRPVDQAILIDPEESLEVYLSDIHNCVVSIKHRGNNLAERIRIVGKTKEVDRLLLNMQQTKFKKYFGDRE